MTKPTRRQFLIGLGATAAGVAVASPAWGHHKPGHERGGKPDRSTTTESTTTTSSSSTTSTTTIEIGAYSDIYEDEY